MSDRYRGRTTRQRNVADKVAREWAERRAAAEVTEAQVDRIGIGRGGGRAPRSGGQARGSRATQPGRGSCRGPSPPRGVATAPARRAVRVAGDRGALDLGQRTR